MPCRPSNRNFITVTYVAALPFLDNVVRCYLLAMQPLIVLCAQQCGIIVH